MAVVWNAIGVFGTLVGVAMCAMAAVVLVARPDRAQNRLLAALIFVDGVGILGGGGAMFLTDDPRLTYAWQALVAYSLTLSFVLYLAFLATLPSPLLAFLRGARARAALLVAGAVGSVLYVGASRPTLFHIVPGGATPWNAVLGPSFLLLLYLGIFPALVLGVVVALDAWRRAPRGSAHRRSAAWYAVAFGTRDVLVLVGIVGLALSPGSDFWGTVWYVAAFAVFVPLLAYAILKTQLFDIDLRIKQSISRGTVAGALLAAFFVSATVAEQFLTDVYGLAVGGVVAGLLLFAVSPLQRAAERLADRAMPGVEASPAYLTYKKLEVYKAAVESAALDGEVTTKERAVLATLRDKLGIAAHDADALEREVLARAA